MAASPFIRALLAAATFERLGLIVERAGSRVAANVPAIGHFSVRGFDCGTISPGAEELALSALHALQPPVSRVIERSYDDLPQAEYRRVEADPSRWSKVVRPPGIRVNMLAWKLHRAFVLDHLVTMPKEGGHVPYAELLRWTRAWASAVGDD